jgi:hypothetical protein
LFFFATQVPDMATPEKVTFGLQPDGSVKMDLENDYCVQYFKNMPCWKNSIGATTGDM